MARLIEILQFRIDQEKSKQVNPAVKRVDEILGMTDDDWARIRKQKEMEANLKFDSDGDLLHFPWHLSHDDLLLYLKKIENRPYAQIDFSKQLTDFQRDLLKARFLIDLKAMERLSFT